MHVSTGLSPIHVMSSVSTYALGSPCEISPLLCRNELNGVLARAQRTAIKMTQKAFYKNSSEELIAELERREALA